MSKKMLVRYEVMTTVKDEREANELGDAISEFVEDGLGYDCAIEVINTETEQLIDEEGEEE